MKNLLGFSKDKNLSSIPLIMILIFLLPIGVVGQGSLTTLTFYSKSLSKNRNIRVYLPEGYNPQDSLRYPTSYFLHGANTNHMALNQEMAEILDSLIANSIIAPMIVVTPDGSIGPWAGSWYTNSALYGNFEDYIIYDLVEFIDATYKTIPSRKKRAIWGLSMGSFGSMKLALKHPNIYCGVASHSGRLDFISSLTALVPVILMENGGAPVSNYNPYNGPITYTSLFSSAGAFSPNLNNSPYPVDLPIDSMGNFIDSTLNKWLLHDPARLAKKITPSSELSIYFDCGLQDERNHLSNTAFAESLNTLSLKYVFQSFEGGHVDKFYNRVPIALCFLDSVMKKHYEIYTHNVSVSSTFVQSGIDLLLISSQFVNPENHRFASYAIITSTDRTFIDSLALFDDGKHGDEQAGDGRWGNYYVLPAVTEKEFSIDISTLDFTDNDYFVINSQARFTSIGPIIFQDYILQSLDTIPNPGETFRFKLLLRNKGMVTNATNITANIACLDTIAKVIYATRSYPNILPGATTSTNSYYTVTTAQDCPGNIDIPFRVNIMSGGYVFWTDTFSVHIYPTGVASRNEQELPEKFSLEQNYPNPFNPSTTIEFALPKSAFVTLKVYNLLGEEVATLVAEQRTAGIHKFNWDARGLASGMYLYRLEVGSFIQTRKLILLR